MTAPTRKLGKLPVKHDPRTLELSSYLKAAALPPMPASADWTTKVNAWGVMLNDQLGDCAIAGPGHHIMAMTSQATTLVTPPDAAILAAYEAVGGYRPGVPGTDNGCVMLDVQNYWRQTGIAGNTTAAFISLDPKSRAMVEAGIFLFGGVHFGIQLPASAQQQLNAGQPWKGPVNASDLRGQWAPGSWGGHAVPGLKYDASGVYVVTWGAVQLMTWQFILDYADEAYVVVDPAWFAPNGTSPSGFDLWTLWADLNAVTDGKHPIPAPPARPVPVTPVTPGPAPVVPTPAPVTPTPAPSSAQAITVAIGGKTWAGTVSPV